MDDIELSDPPCRVRLVRNPRARRFTLRLASDGDGAVLTHPPGIPVTESRAFLNRHSDWLRRALAKQPSAIRIAHGAELPVDGVIRRIQVREGSRRPPVLGNDSLFLQGQTSIGPRVAQWLKLRARDRLEPKVKGYAASLGKSVARVALRDTRSRWGSCSTSGTVSFSWRLAMAPVEVQDYVAAHEAAHMVEMNHSPSYWAVLESLMPGWKPQRDWLRRHGRELHRYRFTAN
jgi:predicted metal-dependent hydrolase